MSKHKKLLLSIAFLLAFGLSAYALENANDAAKAAMENALAARGVKNVSVTVVDGPVVMVCVSGGDFGKQLSAAEKDAAKKLTAEVLASARDVQKKVSIHAVTICFINPAHQQTAKFTLQKPFPKISKESDGEKISVQYAAIHFCRLAGKTYDFQTSQETCGRSAREFVSDETFIAEKTFAAAMEKLLSPHGLGYTEIGGKVVLVKKEEPEPAENVSGEKIILRDKKFKIRKPEYGLREISWKVVVENNSDNPVSIDLTAKFIDRESMQVGIDYKADIKLKPREKKTITESFDIDEKKAGEIAGLVFEKTFN